VYSDNNTLVEKASIYIISKYGEEKPTVFGYISLLAGIINLLGGTVSLLGENNAFTSRLMWLAFVPGDLGIYIFSIGLFFIVIGVFFIKIVEYKHESQCSKCKKFYSMKPEGDAKVREVKTHEGVRRTISAPYKCKVCGYTETRKRHNLVELEPKPSV